MADGTAPSRKRQRLGARPSIEDDFEALAKLLADLGDGAAAAALPDGPATQDDVVRCWPRWIVRTFMQNSSTAARAWLQRLLCTRALCTTDYSGNDCPRELCQLLSKALSAEVDFPAQLFTFVRSCDSAPLCQKVLT
jgi:hypothetical protein